jgi:hypothetical protein
VNFPSARNGLPKTPYRALFRPHRPAPRAPPPQDREPGTRARPQRHHRDPPDRADHGVVARVSTSPPSPPTSRAVPSTVPPRRRGPEVRLAGLQRPRSDTTFAAAATGQERLITVETDLYRAVFSTRGATLRSLPSRTTTAPVRPRGPGRDHRRRRARSPSRSPRRRGGTWTPAPSTSSHPGLRRRPPRCHGRAAGARLRGARRGRRSDTPTPSPRTPTRSCSGSRRRASTSSPPPGGTS